MTWYVWAAAGLGDASGTTRVAAISITGARKPRAMRADSLVKSGEVIADTSFSFFSTVRSAEPKGIQSREIRVLEQPIHRAGRQCFVSLPWHASPDPMYPLRDCV